MEPPWSVFELFWLVLVRLKFRFLHRMTSRLCVRSAQAGPRHLVHTQSYVQKRRIRFGASLSSQLETLPVVVNRSHHNRSESLSNQSISTLRLPQQVASTVRIMDGNRMVRFAQQHQHGHNDSIPGHNEIIPGHDNRMDHFGGASYAPPHYSLDTNTTTNTTQNFTPNLTINLAAEATIQPGSFQGMFGNGAPSQPTMNHDLRQGGQNITFHLAAGATIQPGSFIFGNDAAAAAAAAAGGGGGGGNGGSDPAVMEKLDAIQRSLDANYDAIQRSLDALPDVCSNEIRRRMSGQA